MFSAQLTAVVRWIWLCLLHCLLGIPLTSSLSPSPQPRLHNRHTTNPPKQSNSGAFSVLPPELLLHILYFLPHPHTPSLSHLSQTCAYLHTHVTPTLYRTVLFDDDTNNPPYKTRRLRVFLDTITRNPQLAAYVRSLTLYVGVNFPTDALEALEAILPGLGNLKHFNFDYTYLPGDDIEYLPSAFGSSPPFQLERFLFRGVIPHSDLPSLSAFLQSQSTSLRHLALHSLDDPFVPPLSPLLPLLRILETTVDAAKSIIPHQPSITHFRAFPVVQMYAIEEGTFDGVKVLSAYGTYEAAVHLAAQMKGLTHFQVNAEAPIEDIPTLLSPLAQTNHHLRFIRLTANFAHRKQKHKRKRQGTSHIASHSHSTVSQSQSQSHSTVSASVSVSGHETGETGEISHSESAQIGETEIGENENMHIQKQRERQRERQKQEQEQEQMHLQAEDIRPLGLSLFNTFKELEFVEMRMDARGGFVRFFRRSSSTPSSSSTSLSTSASSLESSTVSPSSSSTVSSSESKPTPTLTSTSSPSVSTSPSSEPSSTSAHGQDEEVESELELALAYRWVRWRDARAWVDDWEDGYEAVVLE